MRNALLIWLSLSLLPAVPAAARQADEPATRAEALRHQREEKQQALRPHDPNAFERAMSVAEDRLLPLLVRDGVHWKLGSLTTGSGFAYGGGYRNRRLFNREGAFTVWAAASLKRYWALEARLNLPDLAGGRLMAGAYARRHSYRQEDFFGVGPAARRGDHATFALEDTLMGAQAGVKPLAGATIGVGYEYSRPRIDAGPEDGAHDDGPTVGRRFDDHTAPGLRDEHDFHRARLFAEYDYRRPINARKGGWYRLDVSRYHDPSGSLSFRRIDLDLRQYASILAERRVFAFRVAATTSNADNGQQIPFYLLAALGGHDTLRGFRDYRFRGPHALLTQTEYRWEVWSGVDAALFYDAGKVALRRGDLNLRQLEDSYGFGFRFHTAAGVLLRIDAGFGSRDGRHLYIVFGDVF